MESIAPYQPLRDRISSAINDFGLPEVLDAISTYLDSDNSDFLCRDEFDPDSLEFQLLEDLSRLVHSTVLKSCEYEALNPSRGETIRRRFQASASSRGSD